MTPKRATPSQDVTSAMVSPAATLAEMARTVRELAAALGLPEAALPGQESYDRLEATGQVVAEPALLLSVDRLERALRLFDGDLSLSMEITGQNPDQEPVALELPNPSGVTSTLGDFQAALRAVVSIEGEGLRLETRLSVRKKRAGELAHALVASREGYAGSEELLAHTGIVVFFQSQAWTQRIKLASLPDWERLGLTGDARRGVVILCDAEGFLSGTSLEVAGLASGKAPRWPALARDDWTSFTKRMRAARELREASTGWTYAPATMPDEVQAQAAVPGLEATARQLLFLRAELSALSVASEIHGDITGSLTARFAGSRPATCVLPNLAEGIPFERVDALIALAAWAYEDSSEVRLGIAREALAGELPHGEAVGLRQLAASALPALEAARANLTLYLRGTLNTYFQAREAARTTVASYAATLRAAVESLTGDLVDNLYRTLAALLLGALAWLFQPAGSLWVLRLATLLYAGYMLFMTLVVLKERHERFEMERAALESQLGAMPELTPSERERLREPASAADGHFSRYYRLIRGTYLILSGIAAVAFLALFTPLSNILMQLHSAR